LNTSTS